MQPIGHIIRLQAQTSPLKLGQKPYRVYDPAPIRATPAMRLTREGVFGLDDGQTFMDVHHARHPHSRRRGETNAISFNFTAHYRRMRDRYGPHLTDGVAGEGILIESDRIWTEDELQPGLVIVTRSGQEVRLDHIVVAAPCAPFSRFALALDAHAPPEMIKETLQFLDGGARGFLAQLDGDEAEIRVGDSVFAA